MCRGDFRMLLKEVAALLSDSSLRIHPRKSAHLCAQCRIMIRRHVLIVSDEMDFRCRAGNCGYEFVRCIDAEIKRVLTSINVRERFIVVFGSEQIVIITAVDDMRALMSEAHLASACGIPVY